MNNLNEVLQKRYYDDIFSSEVLEFYINGFFDSIGFDPSDLEFVFTGFDEVERENNQDEMIKYDAELLEASCEEANLVVSNNREKNRRSKRWIHFEGKSEKLSFKYDFDFTKHVMNKEAFLPFNIEINVMYEGNKYSILLFRGVKERSTKILLYKSSEDYTSIVNNYFFYEKIDIESILAIVMRFVDNPERVYAFYHGLRKTPISYLSRSDCDIMQLDEIEINPKTGKKLEKVIK